MILTFSQFINEAYTSEDIKALNATMKSRKVKHSCQVAELVTKLTSDEDVYNAALYHDYIERGGDEEYLRILTSDYTVELVMALTKTDADAEEVETKNATLEILKRRMDDLPHSMHDDIIMIKICDRIDNLLKRQRREVLNKDYVRKSGQLLQFLYDQSSLSYHTKITKLLTKKLLKAYPKMGKRLNLTLNKAAVNQVPAKQAFSQQDKVLSLTV